MSKEQKIGLRSSMPTLKNKSQNLHTSFISEVFQLKLTQPLWKSVIWAPWSLRLYVYYYVGNWKRGRRDGYGVQESYGKLAGGGDAWLTRGHSLTTWIKFYPFLTTYPPFSWHLWTFYILTSLCSRGKEWTFYRVFFGPPTYPPQLVPRSYWMTLTVLDGSWKQDKFHGWGRMLEFEEIDELLGLASGIESNLRYEGKVPIVEGWHLSPERVN